MNISQLEYFAVAAELQNFTKAGKILHVSQTAITQQMKALEKELGIDLFQRKGRRVKLTEAGVVYHAEVREILRMLDRANEKAFHASEGYTGLISIKFIKGSEQMGISSAVAEFRRRYPGVEFQFGRGDYAQLFDDLATGACDIVLNIENIAATSEDIESIPYCNARIMALMSIDHPCALRDSVTGQDFSNDTIIELVTSTESKRLYEAGFASSGPVPRQIIKMPDAESIALMVASGIGVGFLPEYDLNLIAGMPSVSAVPVEGSSVDLRAFWRRSSGNSAARHFQRFLSAVHRPHR